MHSQTFWGAYSVGQSQRSKWYINENKDVPSPIYNTANQKNKFISPAFKIGKSKRSSIIDLRKHPGIGQYDTKITDISKQKGVKILGKYEIQPFYDSANPARYKPKLDLVTQTAPSFSFTIRQGEVWSKDTPGPNHYFQSEPASHLSSVEKTSRNNLSRSRSTGRRRSESNTAPVNIQTEPSTRGLNKGFTTSEKLKFQDKKTPGIGKYNILTTQNRSKSPAYAFDQSKRSNSMTDNTAPGPGSFNLDTNITQGSSYSIGQAAIKNSLFTVQDFYPGPGAYDPKQGVPNDKKKTGYSFGSKSLVQQPQDERDRDQRKRRERSEAIQKWRNKPTPGPSDYQEIYSIEQKVDEMREQGYRFADHFDPDSEFNPAYIPKNTNPGPGQYNQDCLVIRKNYPSFHIQHRPKPIRQDYEDQPGPADYTTSDDFSKTQGPTIRIGRSLRSNLVTNKFKPGPGSYLLDPSERGRSASIGNRERFDDIRDCPGPGYYNIQGEMGRLPSYMTKRGMQKSHSNSFTMRSTVSSHSASPKLKTASSFSTTSSPDKLLPNKLRAPPSTTAMKPVTTEFKHDQHDNHNHPIPEQENDSNHHDSQSNDNEQDQD